LCRSSDFEAVCRLADGFNGADIRNICTEAGMFAIRADRDFVIEEDFMKATRKLAEAKKLESKVWARVGSDVVEGGRGGGDLPTVLRRWTRVCAHLPACRPPHVTLYVCVHRAVDPPSPSPPPCQMDYQKV
jgi:hypothetical protein